MKVHYLSSIYIYVNYGPISRRFYFWNILDVKGGSPLENANIEPNVPCNTASHLVIIGSIGAKPIPLMIRQHVKSFSLGNPGTKLP